MTNLRVDRVERATYPDRVNPYVGPRPFRPDEAHLFFGREREARDLLALIAANREVLFFAQSGAGKSSLINVRLIPALQAKGFEVLPIGRVSGTQMPTSEIDNIYVYNLLRSLNIDGTQTVDFAHLRLIDFLSDLVWEHDHWRYAPDEDTTAQTTQPIGDSLYSIPPRILILDQFEELLTTYPEAWQQRQSFLEQLDQAMVEDRYLWVVVTLREDYVAALSRHSHLMSGKLRVQYYLQQLDADAALEAIAKPALQAGLPFTEDAAAWLVAELRKLDSEIEAGSVPGEYVEPAQLQVVCYQIWKNLGQRRGTLNAITRDNFSHDIVQQALMNFYEEAIEEVAQRTVTPKTRFYYLFEEALQTSTGTLIPLSQASALNIGIPQAALNLFVDRYLLRRYAFQGEDITYRITHDRLRKPIRDVRAQRRGDSHIIGMGGDTLDVEDIQKSVVAIGEGAETTVNYYIQQLAAADEREKARLLDLRLLAEGVRDYAHRLGKIIPDSQANKTHEPYRGLDAYTIADAEYFYGREIATQALLQLLSGSHLTILQAESGAGKSSLLAAGVVARLLATGHLVSIVRPYDADPSLAIKQTFLPELEQTTFLKASSLRNFLFEVTKVLGDQTKLYLILDQFEEFFTTLRDDQTRNRFIADLRACYADPALKVHWLFSIRTEYFGHLAGFEPQINAFISTYRLNRLSRTEARAVIVKPLAQVGIQMEDMLVNTLIDELKQPDSEEIDPPQLQLVCSALYNAFVEQHAYKADTIDLALYKQLGKVQGILSNYVKRVLSQAFTNNDERQQARRVLIELVSSDRRRIRLTQIELHAQFSKDQATAASVRKVLKILVDQRLVVTNPDETSGQTYYELSHDYLVNEIQVDPETRAQKAAQELLTQEVETYQRYQILLSTQKFAIINSQRPYLTLDMVAQELLDRSASAIQQVEREREAARQRELDAAQQLAKEQRKRAQQLQWAVVGALLLTAIAIGLGWRSQRNATEAQNQASTATVALATSEVALKNEQLAKGTAQAEATQAELARANEQLAKRRSQIEATRAINAQNTAQAEVFHAAFALATATVAFNREVIARAESEQKVRRSQADNLAYNALNQLQADHYASAQTTSAAREAVVTTLIGDGYVTNIAAHTLFDTLAAVPVGHQLSSLQGKFTQILPRSDGAQLLTIDATGKLARWQLQPVTGEYRQRSAIGDVSAVAWASDGQRFAITRDQGLWIVDGENQTTLRPTSPITAPIHALLWQPGTDTLALLRGANRVTLIDSTSAETAFSWPDSRLTVTALAWSSDGKLLALGDSGGGVTLWNPTTNQTRHLQGSAQFINVISWRRDSAQVAAASEDHFVYLWDVDSGALLRKSFEHLQGANYVAWLPDGERLITAAGTGEIVVWQPETQAKRVVRPVGKGSWTTLQVSGDGKQVFTLPSGGGVESWAVAPDIARTTVQGQLGEITQLDWHPRQEDFVAVDEQGQIEIYQNSRARPLLFPSDCPCFTLARWSHDGERLAIADNSGQVTITMTHAVSATGGQPPLALAGSVCNTSSGCQVTALAWSMDDTQLATGGNDGTVRIWDGQSGVLVQTFDQAHTVSAVGVQDVTVLAWRAANPQLLSGGADGALYLWDARSGDKPNAPFLQLVDQITAAAWNVSGEQVLIGSLRGKISLLTVADKQTQDFPPHAERVQAVGWLTADTFATVGADNTIKLWQAATPNEPVFEVSMASGGNVPEITVATFAPDSTKVLTGHADGTLRTWWVQPQPWLDELARR